MLHMKKILLLVVLCFSLGSCNSSKGIKTKKSKTTQTRHSNSSNSNPSKTITNIIDHAQTFEGTRYKYGGMTKRGMDCSGLVVTAFQKENVKLPRTTADLKNTGTWIDVKKVKEGDLLFFATKKNSRKVNHVGIVTKVRPGHVEFIHSTSSRGVITSKLSERYWYQAYVQARRVL